VGHHDALEFPRRGNVCLLTCSLQAGQQATVLHCHRLPAQVREGSEGAKKKKSAVLSVSLVGVSSGGRGGACRKERKENLKVMRSVVKVVLGSLTTQTSSRTRVRVLAPREQMRMRSRARRTGEEGGKRKKNALDECHQGYPFRAQPNTVVCFFFQSSSRTPPAPDSGDRAKKKTADGDPRDERWFYSSRLRDFECIRLPRF